MENEQTYGERGVFAVSVAPRSGDGPLRTSECGLWLGGLRLGDRGEAILTESFLRALDGLARAEASPVPAPRPTSTAAGFLSMIEDGRIADASRHSFLAFAGFDDFLKLFYKGRESTTFVWAVHPAALSGRHYVEYEDQVHVVEVSNATLERVIADVLASGI
jgi:hypothetical protein